MFLTNDHSRRLALYALAAASLGSTGFLAACGESDAETDIAIRSPDSSEISLDAAILLGDDDAMHALIKSGAPVNSKSTAGDTPLHVATALGRIDAVVALIKAGADLEAVNSSGVTPLFNAAFFCHAGVLEKIIDAGANKEATDQFGTPIRQIMETPWEQIRPIYEMVHSSIGLPFDEQRIRDARPNIVELLR